MNGITSVVKGNIKLGEGDTWNVNLPPILTCKDKPCYTEGKCYNLKAWNLYPSAQKSWLFNWNHYNSHPDKFFSDIVRKIKNARKPPQWFRWQSSGEIPDQRYLHGIKRVARECPEVKFLVFTKRYDLSFRNIPSNLQVIASAWPGFNIPKHILRRFPVAWMNDGRETRQKARRRQKVDCPGYCPSCRICWSLSDKKRDVVFHLH